MPLDNSIFRIVHRTAQDPHGVEGYFIHEIYLSPDHTIRSWRAAVSIGAPDLLVLRDHMIRVIEAFNYPPLEYKELLAGVKVLEDPSQGVTYTLMERHRAPDQPKLENQSGG